MTPNKKETSTGKPLSAHFKGPKDVQSLYCSGMKKSLPFVTQGISTRKCTMIMASGPITSWEIDGETVETVSDFIFWGSKITADGDCCHEIKRRLLLGRKVMTNKSREITLPTKVRLVKAMVFPVVIYGCESWTLKKAEHQRIDALNSGVGEDS